MTPLSEDEHILLKEIRNLVNAATREVCANHYDAPTQEPPTTSRLAQAIESELKHHPINVNDLTVEIATQDVPDRGSTMESLIGADLYISIVWKERDINKGMLIQSKWDYASSDPKLDEQIKHMQARTDEAYVWLYGRYEVDSLPAAFFTGKISTALGVSVGQIIADGFACTRGDPKIGRDLNKPRAEAMNDMLNRLHAEAALEFAVSNKRKRG